MLYTKLDTEREFTEEQLVSLPEYRSSFRRDYGRLIHSAAFRRLQGKTQIFPGLESDFFRNRLTHSLEVAQIAKTIALKLNHETPFLQKFPIDTDLIETIALAHDMGHPPFGHTGEMALNECMCDAGGFEGNAQTLRILSRLEKKRKRLKTTPAEQYGLNLTFRTLAGILKYDRVIPAMQGEILCKGYYQSESALVNNIKQHVLSEKHQQQPMKTVECQIMDIADDIAYSTYDTEDALKGGFINPLHMITADETIIASIVKKLSPDLVMNAADVQKTLLEIFYEPLMSKVEQQLSENPVFSAAQLYQEARTISEHADRRTDLTSRLVDEFVRQVKIDINQECPALSIVTLADSAKRKVDVLKHYSYEAVIQSRRLRIVAYRASEIIKTIFSIVAEPKNNGEKLLPDDVRVLFHSISNENERLRIICDFIASMSDNYAIEFYSRLKSGSQQSIFKPF